MQINPTVLESVSRNELDVFISTEVDLKAIEFNKLYTKGYKSNVLILWVRESVYGIARGQQKGWHVWDSVRDSVKNSGQGFGNFSNQQFE